MITQNQKFIVYCSVLIYMHHMSQPVSIRQIKHIFSRKFWCAFVLCLCASEIKGMLKNTQIFSFSSTQFWKHEIILKVHRANGIQKGWLNPTVILAKTVWKTMHCIFAYLWFLFFISFSYISAYMALFSKSFQKE